MAQVHERFHAAGSTCQHQAVDDRAGLRAGHRVGDQPRLPSGTERTDVTLDEIIVDRREAIVDVAAQVRPLVARIANGLASRLSGSTCGAFSSSQALNDASSGTLCCWRSA